MIYLFTLTELSRINYHGRRSWSLSLSLRRYINITVGSEEAEASEVTPLLRGCLGSK